MANFFEWVVTNWSELLIVFFSILGVASAVAKLTPTKADDEVINWLLKVVHGLGLTKREVKKSKK